MYILLPNSYVFILAKMVNLGNSVKAVLIAL